jgi:hypothetical protein
MSPAMEEAAGFEWGWSDGTHPSGVCIHAMFRDPDGWAEQTREWQFGYNRAWFDATTVGA